jgi:dihydrofolate synthase/folylpolyglutamate synthase
MNYRQTIDFLFSSLPMFHRIGDAAIKKDLTNIRLLCDMLGQPQTKFPSVHIAGTNGKGSTSHMIAAVFQATGQKVGLYTSPHYVDFRERIKVNGEMIGEKDVIRFVKNYKEKWSDIQPSFFEITLAMAFDFFRKEKIDIAVIETGLGGRLDSTNIITPQMSVITNIGFDHMKMLGNTLPEIAFEKAGIIKYKVPVVIGEWQQETAQVFKNKALKENAPIHFASKHLVVVQTHKTFSKQILQVRTREKEWFRDLSTDMTGPYQLRNVRTVLECFYRWNQYYPAMAVTDREIKRGLGNVKNFTKMIGRWMVIQQKPLVLTDAAHNHHGMMAMLPELLKQPVKTRHFVLGFVSDKDIINILALFPKDGRYYWCAPDIPRARPAGEVALAGFDLGLQGVSFKSVMEAYRQAINTAGKADLVFVGGSSYVVGDFLAGISGEMK